MENRELLFEIGCEEIPARFLHGALAHLKSRAALLESDYGLPIAGDIAVFGTPRRLCLSVTGLPVETVRIRKEVVGPAVRAAFDTSGAPTKACLGFAKSAGVTVEQLEKRTLPKGEYVVAMVELGGESALTALQRFLLETIVNMPLGKSMRWESTGARFFRPIRWLMAVLASGAGAEIIPLEFAGLRAGNHTFGHRFMSRGAIVVSSRSEYLGKLLEHYVVADPDERRARVLKEARAAAAEAGGQLLFDAAHPGHGADPLAVDTFFTTLLDEVTNLCEWPIGINASFDPSALALPRELLLTAMRQHQRYFAVCDETGALKPSFVAIAATRVADPEVVRRGNARVLRARFADAEYFNAEDLKRPLTTRLSELKAVVYHKKLGSSFAKAERAFQLAWSVAAQIGIVSGDPEPLEAYLDDQNKASKLGRAAALAKADLTTLTVGEFPELQGIMGAHIASAQAEDRDVALAVSDHYRPRSAEDTLPRNELGALLAIGDKLDTVIGIIAAGQMPTGSSDPFALRRSALGVLRILLDRKWSISMRTLVAEHLRRFDTKIAVPQQAPAVAERILGFISERFLQQQLPEQPGRAAQLVRAVVLAGVDDPLQASYRIAALKTFAASPEFEALTITLKRVLNIVKTKTDHQLRSELLRHDAERTLMEQTQHALQAQTATPLTEAGYLERLRRFSELRPTVDTFFDAVLVMDEDLEVRQNRLRLLQDIASLVADIADFREL